MSKELLVSMCLSREEEEHLDGGLPVQDQQSLMDSHQFLLSWEVCVMTPVTTSDKSDEALVKVVRFCWSLKPFDINLCRGRWAETVSERQTEERVSENVKQGPPVV